MNWMKEWMDEWMNERMKAMNERIEFRKDMERYEMNAYESMIASKSEEKACLKSMKWKNTVTWDDMKYRLHTW